MNELISVIIPIYNVQQYIRRCLLSLEAQTHRNFEVICIDDGSTDNSYTVAKECLDNCTFKSVIKTYENAGVSAARNKGLDLAQGKYICFLDSDDMLNEYYLESMFNRIIVSDEIGCIICKRCFIDENDESIGKRHGQNRMQFQVLDSEKVLSKLLYHEISAGIWNLLIRKNILDENKLRFAEGYAYSEDLQLVWKIVACCPQVALLDSELYLYRMRSTSAMTSFSRRRFDGLVLFTDLENFINNQVADFAEEFQKYGVAYWVWSTMWQAAMLSKTYNEFIANIQIDYRKYVNKLYSYPNLKVRASSFMLINSKRLYYYFIRLYLRNKKT